MITIDDQRGRFDHETTLPQVNFTSTGQTQLVPLSGDAQHDHTSATNIRGNSTTTTDALLSDYDYPFDLSLDLPSMDWVFQTWATPLPNASVAESTVNTSPADAEPSFDHVNQQLLVSRAHKVRKAWPRKTASPVICMVHKLWHHAIEHPQHNLFSKSLVARASASSDGKRPRSSKWNFDEDCRARLIRDCEERFLPVEKYDGGVTAPGSPRITIATTGDTAEVEGLSPQSGRSRFPSVETLDMSIDFYFDRSHPVIPFIHKATFDAKLVPSPLLFAICLVGYNGLNPVGARNFVLAHVGGLMRYCRLDLTYKALGKIGAQTLLASLASALVVLYLCLDLSSVVDIHQAHMLAIQTLFIADRHRLFRAGEAGSLSEVAMGYNKDRKSFWTAWARVESLKRLVLSLIMIDCAYTRMLDLAAIISIDRVEAMLPCTALLFDSSDETSFYSRLELHTSIMPVAELSNPDFEASAENEFSLRVRLAYLSLVEAASRHRLLPNNPALANSFSAPTLVYHDDTQAAKFVQNLLQLALPCSDITGRSRPAIWLMWNYLCLSLVADINRVQTACGKDGLTASRHAIAELRHWASSTHARRAVVHSSQIYNLASRHRIGDDKTLCHEAMLSTSAMVQAIYFLVHDTTDEKQYSAMDFAGELDWASLGPTGLLPSVSSMQPDAGAFQHEVRMIHNFISDGRDCPVEGQPQPASISAARKVLLKFAQLLDETSSHGIAEHSELLRTVADFFSALSE
jgi:hypothetical protein